MMIFNIHIHERWQSPAADVFSKQQCPTDQSRPATCAAGRMLQFSTSKPLHSSMLMSDGGQTIFIIGAHRAWTMGGTRYVASVSRGSGHHSPSLSCTSSVVQYLLAGTLCTVPEGTSSEVPNGREQFPYEHGSDWLTLLDRHCCDEAHFTHLARDHTNGQSVIARHTTAQTCATCEALPSLPYTLLLSADHTVIYHSEIAAGTPTVSGPLFGSYLTHTPNSRGGRLVVGLHLQSHINLGSVMETLSCRATLHFLISCTNPDEDKIQIAKPANTSTITGSGHQSPGLWRHPDDRSSEFNSIQHWTSLAQELEAGKFHGIFIADVLGGYDVYGGPQNLDPAIKSGAQWPVNEPLSMVPAMAAATKSIGFGVTVSTSYEQPYHLARRMSTVDHLTGGRYINPAERNAHTKLNMLILVSAGTS
nr:dimethyl-sulfide monooxygenase [Quercus suber]